MRDYCELALRSTFRPPKSARARPLLEDYVHIGIPRLWIRLLGDDLDAATAEAALADDSATLTTSWGLVGRPGDIVLTTREGDSRRRRPDQLAIAWSSEPGPFFFTGVARSVLNLLVRP